MTCLSFTIDSKAIVNYDLTVTPQSDESRP